MLYNLSLVLIVLVFSSDIGTELETIQSTIETTEEVEAPGTDVVGAVHYCIYIVYFACELRPSGSPQPLLIYIKILFVVKFLKTFETKYSQIRSKTR